VARPWKSLFWKVVKHQLQGIVVQPPILFKCCCHVEEDRGITHNSINSRECIGPIAYSFLPTFKRSWTLPSDFDVFASKCNIAESPVERLRVRKSHLWGSPDGQSSRTGAQTKVVRHPDVGGLAIAPGDDSAPIETSLLASLQRILRQYQFDTWSICQSLAKVRDLHFEVDYHLQQLVRNLLRGSLGTSVRQDVASCTLADCRIQFVLILAVRFPAHIAESLPIS